MGRKRKPILKVCSVTGLETSETNFYKNQFNQLLTRDLLINFEIY